jgi:hypothetical protein
LKPKLPLPILLATPSPQSADADNDDDQTERAKLIKSNTLPWQLPYEDIVIPVPSTSDVSNEAAKPAVDLVLHDEPMVLDEHPTTGNGDPMSKDVVLAVEKNAEEDKVPTVEQAGYSKDEVVPKLRDTAKIHEIALRDAIVINHDLVSIEDEGGSDEDVIEYVEQLTTSVVHGHTEKHGFQNAEVRPAFTTITCF